MYNFFVNVGLYFSLLKGVFVKFKKRKIYFNRILNEIEVLGLSSLFIVVIVSVFMGAVVTIQTGIQFDTPLLPIEYIGYVARESIVLEFAPTFISLILAGKIGSSIASEIGTMRVTEQIDALEVMGINAKSYIILPKIIACLLFFPVLVILSMLVGILGGLFAGSLTDLLSVQDFIQGLQMWPYPFHVFYALIKTIFFAFIISTVSSFFGFYAKGGALGVGKSSTKAVVVSCVVILIFNFLLTQIMLG